MANTTTTRTPVGFASLPAELRNEIYHYNLIQPTPILLPYAYEKLPFREPALLAASPWLRREAAPIFYGSNTFEAPSPPSAHRFLSQQTGETIALIRHFRPINLILPLSAPARKRWFDALRWNINRLVPKKNLSPDAIEVPLRRKDVAACWCRLQDIEDFEIVSAGEGGDWRLEWRELDRSLG